MGRLKIEGEAAQHGTRTGGKSRPYKRKQQSKKALRAPAGPLRKMQQKKYKTWGAHAHPERAKGLPAFNSPMPAATFNVALALQDKHCI